ncbi:MAG: hypothetical protein CTY19_03175 [Methylomonas sp.]|nr:MAG: hypothetical protein CTY19_03175 [Methylomonas sp.]
MKTFAALIILCFAHSASFAGNSNSSQPSNEEIQVLIDVSGSMKQNDRQNLRVDATQLLINLLPDKANASLWLFAEQTTLLSHSDAVDNNWRMSAIKASKNIHSHGVFTNIEEAIKTTLEKGFNGNGNKNLIILTDGMVDISKDIMVSADSRERILSEWLPRLRERNIKVQTIGLSNQVDKELLERLAIESSGWHETAESADQLQRMFLKTAQKVAPKDTLPLVNNQFNVDSSIQEFSLLVFKKPDAAATQLRAPDQQKISKNNAANNVSWLETTGYDLITVKQPMPGNWQIEAAIDPDNQVMILTDLKMHLNDLPNFIGEKQQLPLKLYFTEKNDLISRTDFLNLVTVSFSIDKKAAIQLPALTNESGYFGHTLNELPPGKHVLSIVADGKTFKREVSKELEVIASPITVKPVVDIEHRAITLKFEPDIAIIDTAHLHITAQIQHANNPAISKSVEDAHGEWLLKLEPLAVGETVSVHFEVTANTLDGKTINPALAPVKLDDSLFTSPATAKATEEPISSASAHSESHESSADTTAATHQKDTEPAVEAEKNWAMIIGAVLGINFLLCVIGFFGYKALKKANLKRQQQLLERLA